MRKDNLLSEKVIIVTGGTGVLGRSFVQAISKAGAIVAVLSRTKGLAENIVQSIITDGGEAIALLADVTRKDQLLSACDQVISKYRKIDGLVNAAGGNIPEAVVQPEDDLFQLDFEAIEKVMQSNLFGTLLPTQVFGNAIKENGSGSIVNISSITSTRAVTRVLGYSLSKAAIECYTKWFAVELAHRFGDKIRINALTPGFFLTEQNRSLVTNVDGSYTERGMQIVRGTPYNRLGTPDELQGALVWLLSDTSKFVTGTSIVVDGGFSAFSGV